jgi:hypothetical protein
LAHNKKKKEKAIYFWESKNKKGDAAMRSVESTNLVVDPTSIETIDLVRCGEPNLKRVYNVGGPSKPTYKGWWD